MVLGAIPLDETGTLLAPSRLADELRHFGPTDCHPFGISWCPVRHFPASQVKGFSQP